MKQFLAVGQIINTHGIKGELKVYPLTDDIKRFRKLKKVYVNGIEREVVWCKLQNDRVILKIDGIDSIEDAVKYKEKYIEVSREDAIKLPEGRYFVTDIIGCTVLDENGVDLGKIYDVIHTKNNDVYWIKEGKELLIPVLKEIVISIDVENQKIVIKPVETWQEK
ncbi:ribosome maturation factor RimM [Clostridium thailandense]|uniref:Ribosome maturation factor RimM n=1 Tax=Clostridium thailandense TaxID=2794346 RepID=A0A949WPX4_9CLOT|nr:ribosome maturation factor RimM [Clostridium thailandense]MBV7271971.1 16S rRNA processing protein RimM [Clostridium thailandense]MCH5137197.1 16S rRNA processing protein RimM [Clostridiaceae bacterium UIB06]